MKFIVVHAGRRDDYQVALALYEDQMLYCLITDYYSPDCWFFQMLSRISPSKVTNLINRRYKRELPRRKVSIKYMACIYGILYRITRKTYFSKRKDQVLGEYARKHSLKRGIPILSMSTYAAYAFNNNPIKPKLLFQFHPTSTYVKNILKEEILLNPISKHSIEEEYEFSLSNESIEALSSEAQLADYVICASSVTKDSLVTDNIPSSKIKVIPYGVDLELFPYKERERETNTFKVIFIGSLNQRKGVTYLLDAVDGLSNVELIIVTRGIFDSNLLSSYNTKKIHLYQNIPHADLLGLLHRADCFILPSLVEGFGQVILEAMSTGLPVIVTENTIAKDLIEDRINGFIVPIRCSKSIREHILFLQNNPSLANQIGFTASQMAQRYTWEKFRRNISNYILTLNSK